MDSIEEFEIETDSPTYPQGLFVSVVLTPNPPPRSNNLTCPKNVCKVTKPGSKLTSSDNTLKTTKNCASIAAPTASRLGYPPVSRFSTWNQYNGAAQIQHLGQRRTSATFVRTTRFSGILARLTVTAEQEGENLSGLSTNPDKDIFVVRENGTTCLMVEFAVRFTVPFDVLAINGIDLITENAYLALPRGADIEGKCGSQDADIHISWKDKAYTLRINFVKETRDKGDEVWKISKLQFVYDTSEKTHFINPYNPGKHTASSHGLSALVTPAGRSYVCEAKQTLTLISSDHQKGVTVAMSDIQIQPFDINSDFMFSEAYKCITDQREQLEETLPLILGFILGLIIVITLSVYHFHLKLTAVTQPQLPRDRSMYKNM
ncbi:lysosome-associated membrane glycoprotein 5 [Salvelinus namaycush]|uniref:Lysosome-associated membrane glycoprotein 5 n=1 Tax=Salvelinus namaycush TaxID=8040 RepID=A0A8U0PDQ1_SALNM|nr:lysosome-associated membrane glycoprotein 5 [Salvelinus namaycush]